MGSELKIIRGSLSAGRCTESAKTGAIPAAAVQPSITGIQSDQVSLSKLYHAIQSSAATILLQSLELQIGQRTYLIPAMEISRSLVREHLRVA